MKIYLTKNDILKILVERFNLESWDVVFAGGKLKEICLVHDELYWDGNEQEIKIPGGKD